jgi:hypothetical protein
MSPLREFDDQGRERLVLPPDRPFTAGALFVLVVAAIFFGGPVIAWALGGGQ